MFGKLLYPLFLSLPPILRQARRWHHPEGPPRRFLSHLLTFPLTLATGLHEAGLGFPPRSEASSGAESDQEGLSTKTAGGYSITVACIGARAESSLPPALWRELLFALPLVHFLDLHHIGPEVSHPSGLVPPTDRGARLPLPGSPLTSVNLDGRTVNITCTRAILGQEAGRCGGVGDTSEGGDGSVAAAVAERAVAKADAIVFFNPGFGHPHLREGWEGALERLICTGKPLIVTCHSLKDLDRDARQVHAVAERSCVDWVSARGSHLFPRENPFRSLITAEDPLSRSHGAPEIVSSNWGMFVVPRGTKSSQRL